MARQATPTALPSATAPNSRSMMLVTRGDSLWAIAQHLAGPGAPDLAVEAQVHRLWTLNERRIGTGDPNLIFPGTRLKLR